MTDPRYTKLADLLVNYSARIKKGDRALLDMIDVPDEFSIKLVRAVRAAGGLPFVEVRHTRVSRELLLGVTEAQAAQIRDIEMFRMRKMDAYIAIRGSANASENSDVPARSMQLYSRTIRPVQD
ncbi:MAG: aminopeptidase, partial [Limisphaerales bacterium]